VTRITGRSGSRRRRWSLIGATVSVLLVSLFVVPSAFAVHDEGVFQLDGNATKADVTNAIDADPGAGTDFGDDWDNVCAEQVGPATAVATCGTAVETAGATDVSWVSEPDRSTSIFTGGGSKDPQDLNNWLWKDAGGLPDKDNLRHAFAARYTKDPNTPTEEQFLYFGSDRFDNSGDAVQGFWFLQAPLAADGASSQGGNLFTNGAGGTPAHTPGDLLVISDFSNGGAVSTINIYEWVASGGDTTTHLDFVDGGTTALCGPTLSGDNFCGIVNPANQSPTPSPWAFLDKSGSTSFLNGEFFEAGINLTGLGFDDECFSTVVSETRSSTSPTATLKDFVVGQFGQCTTTLVTTPKAADGTTNLGADTDNDNLVETSIGPGTVSVKDSALLTVNGLNTFSGTLSFFICGPITTPMACATGGVAAGSQTVTANGTYTSDAVMLTSAGRYCWRGEFDATTANVPDASDSTVESAGNTGECFEVLPVQTSLDTAAVNGTVNFGQAVQDNATLSGAATQPGTDGTNLDYPSINATPVAIGGTIRFTLFGPSETGCGTQTSNSTTVGDVNPIDVPVNNGNATYGSVSYTPGEPGTYHWKAAFIPVATDVNNLGSTHNATCNDADENVIVQRVGTTTTTRQFVFPQDKVTITTTAGGNLAGSVAIRLFDTLENCQADTDGTGNDPGLLYSEGATGDAIQHPISGATTATATTSNTTVRVTSSTTVFWNVVYTSTNPAQTGSSSSCAESTQVTYAGNDATITIP
jgi:hypothetical protein